MAETKKKNHTVYRLPPCPIYDVEGTESWLSDLAQEGLMLEKDGFFAGFMSFQRTAPRAAQYRLEAIQKLSGLLSDGDETPSDEVLELSEKYGWEYLVKYGDFHIYRSFDFPARELNTDPDVQAMALNEVRKRQRNAAIWSVIYLIILLFCSLYQQPLLSAIAIGTPCVLLFATLIIWAEIGQLVTFLHLHKLHRKLKETGSIDHKKDWKKKAAAHHVEKILYLCLVILVLILTFQACTSSVMDEGEISLEDYSEDPPFVTIADMDPTGKYSMQELSYSNTVKEWSDWIAPSNYEWHEYASLITDDGTISGPLSITYHETVHPWVARLIAREYLIDAQKSQHFHLMDLQELDVDYAVAYAPSPTVLLQKGNIIIRATVYFNYEDGSSLYQQWAELMAQMLQQTKPEKS